MTHIMNNPMTPAAGEEISDAVAAKQPPICCGNCFYWIAQPGQSLWGECHGDLPRGIETGAMSWADANQRRVRGRWPETKAQERCRLHSELERRRRTGEPNHG